MVITDLAQFELLVQEVRDQILSESQGVGEVDIVDNLDSIYSLPALKLNDSGDQVVEAPLSLLSAPAEEAAALARAAAYDANTAAESANSAASSANLATDKTNEAISNAQSATQRAESSADKANIAAQNADEATAQVLSGESERVEAENARQAAETERQSAEEERKSAEEARKLAEQSRELAESSRVSAEESRVTAESERVTAESSRAQAETERVLKESERESAESTRQLNETTRQSNEDTRVQLEQTRLTNEEQRVSAESSRETEYTDLKQRADALIDDNEAAIENANTAAENANTAIANMENTYAKKDEIPDVSEFITTSVDNLVNYYRKSETYNLELINSLIGSITTINFKIVDSLPGTGENNLIYLVPSSKQEEKNVKDEYIWIDGSWELIGSTKIDLSNYYTRDEVNSTFALKTELAWDTITGKPVWIGSSKPTYTWSEINEKPTTISGYGITDAYIKNGTIVLGSNNITPLTSSNYSDTLDGRYVKKSGDTMTGGLTIPVGSAGFLFGSEYAGGRIVATNATTMYVQGGDNGKLYITARNIGTLSDFDIKSNKATINSNTIWHSGNDGSGSGLDADLLDGYQSTSFDLSTNLGNCVDYGYYVIGLLQITDYTTAGNHANGRLSFIRTNGNNRVQQIQYALSTFYNTTNVRFSYITLGNNIVSPCTFTYNSKKWAGFVVTDGKWGKVSSAYTNGVICTRFGLRRSENSTPFLLKYYTSKTETINNSEVYNSLVINGSDIIDDYVTAGRFIGSLSGNASSATKLQTPRTIWGQSFDGTENVDGSITINGDIRMIGSGTFFEYPNLSKGFYFASSSDGSLGFYGHNDFIYTKVFGIIKYDTGNWGIGTTNPSYKCHVDGTFYASGAATLESTLTVNGDLTVKGTIIDSTSSDIRLKNILEQVDYQEKLLSLGDVVDFNYNDTAFSRENSSNLEHRSYTGLIYQNVKEILPQMAHEDDDGYGYLNYLSHDYINLIAGALQLTITKLKQLEKRISVLEEENINLKLQLSN